MCLKKAPLLSQEGKSTFVGNSKRQTDESKQLRPGAEEAAGLSPARPPIMARMSYYGMTNMRQLSVCQNVLIFTRACLPDDGSLSRQTDSFPTAPWWSSVEAERPTNVALLASMLICNLSLKNWYEAFPMARCLR
jgi:hypothetical protein